MKLLLTTVFFVLVAFSSSAQNFCFHKVYTFDDTLGIISNVFVEDSTYVIGASTGRWNRTSASIIVLDKFGNVIENNIYKDSLRDESLGFTGSEIYKDPSDTLWFLYTSRNEQGWEGYPKILKFYNPSNAINSIEIDTLVNHFFQYIDKSKLIVDFGNDKYYLAMKYNYFQNLDTNSTLPWDTGTFVFCFTVSTDSLVYIKRHNFSTIAANKPRQIMYNYLSYSNGNHLLIQAEDYDNSHFSSKYCKILFKTIDPSLGSVLSTKQLHDSPWSVPGYGAAFINNEKDLLISYTDSDTLYSTTTIPQPYYAVRPAVARLDSNFNVVWKDTLYSYLSSTLSPYGCLEKIVVEGDSTFVSAFAYLQVTDEGLPNQKNYDAVRITKRSQNTGEVIWNRDFTYFDLDYYNDPLYTIHDLERTLDGGYIFVGQVENFDSLQANAPGQLGYVLKTNCLGFLADPQAGFTTQNNDSLGVNFQNTSLMGGSYLWDFGDSITLTTGDFDSAQPPVADSLQNAVFHQYTDTGMYKVTLIAYGCNGANDTVKTTVHITKFNEPEPPINPNILNYMALGPNPVKSGESVGVYVGNLPSENCWLSFYDYQGKLVLERAIPQDKSTYIIVLPFSAGVYQAVLRDGEKKLEVEKVMVY